MFPEIKLTKTFSFLFLLVLFNWTAKGQVEVVGEIFGGLNYASLTNADRYFDNSEPLTTFHIGAGVDFRLASFYSLQPQLLYSAQGNEHNDIILPLFDTSFNGMEKWKLNYLSFVVNNKFYFLGSDFFFQAAPFLDILLSHTGIARDPEGFDIGFQGGIGYNFGNGLSVDVKYKQGLIEIFGRNVETGNGAETTDIDELLLNKVIQLSVGYRFNL